MMVVVVEFASLFSRTGLEAAGWGGVISFRKFSALDSSGGIWFPSPYLGVPTTLCELLNIELFSLSLYDFNKFFVIFKNILNLQT